MQAMPSVNLWPAAAAPALGLSSWDMTRMTVWSLPVLSRKYCLSYHKNPFKVLYSLVETICLILSKLSNVPFIVTGKKSPSQLSHIHPRFVPASPTHFQNIPSAPSSAPPQKSRDNWNWYLHKSSWTRKFALPWRGTLLPSCFKGWNPFLPRLLLWVSFPSAHFLIII